MRRGTLRRIAAGIVASSAMVIASAAAADAPPTLWERAKDPDAGARFRLHVQAEERLQLSSVPHGHRSMTLEIARADLEKAGAATSPDVRLRFDLGEVYYHLNRYREALAVLQPALAMAPRHSAASTAWLDLAFAAAHLDRSTLELDGYDQFLATALLVHTDLSILSNRAEAEMRLGNMDAAIAGYRDVIEQGTHIYGAADPAVLVLARWGLAVALDRSRDAAQADHEAFIAAQDDPEEKFIGDPEEVFFVPEYERYWYFALGRTQHAKHAPDPVRALSCWVKVVETWSHYLGEAGPKDRWLDLARAHLAAAEAERRALASRLGKDWPSRDARMTTFHGREGHC